MGLIERSREYDALSYDIHNDCRGEPLFESLKDNIDPDEVFYDIGANIGEYTLMAGAMGGKVVAIEPHPDVYQKLLKNTKLNSFSDNIELINCGIGNDNNTTTFYNLLPHGRSTFNEKAAKNTGVIKRGEQDFPVKRLDTLVKEEELPNPSHIKIDVEGYDLEVLRGSSEILKKNRPTIYIDTHGQHDELRSFLCNLDYDVEEQSEKYSHQWIASPKSDKEL